MRLVATCLDALPPLAWAAALSKGSDAVDLLHGPNLELFPTGFFEGAWDGDFAAAAFAKAANLFGSGGSLSQEGAVFVGPSHTLEPLYIARTPRLSAVSNSLAFLLWRCGLALDPYNFHYGRSFSAIVHGLERTPQEIELEGGTLTLLHHHNAMLKPDGSFSVLPKTLPPNFADFGEYRSYLTDVTCAVFRNAEDSRRRFRFKPISTMSSGYDSSASAVIAKSCGCAESISLTTSNAGKEDSGRAVADALGLRHTEFARMERASGDPMLEAEFLAPGMQGEDIVYSAFGERLKGRILVTGFQGGKIWDRRKSLGRHIKRSDISGCSLGEFRLRMNFLHLPIPFIGIQRGDDLYAISNMPDMKAYSVPGSYDRPVPRRILEEAGVGRSLFGQAKRGASILLFQGQDRMSPAARASILDYWKQRGSHPRYLARVQARTLWWTLGRKLYSLFRKVGKVLRIDPDGRLATALARLSAALFGVEAPIFGASHPQFTVLLIWALSKIEPRYAVAERHISR